MGGRRGSSGAWARTRAAKVALKTAPPGGRPSRRPTGAYLSRVAVRTKTIRGNPAPLRRGRTAPARHLHMRKPAPAARVGLKLPLSEAYLAGPGFGDEEGDRPRG